MSEIKNNEKSDQKPSTTKGESKLRLNREKVKVLAVRSSLATGRLGCAGSCRYETSID